MRLLNYRPGLLRGFGGAGAPPGRTPEAVLSRAGCVEPFPEPIQRRSWGQRAGGGGVGLGSRAKAGDPRVRPEWTQEKRFHVSALRKQQPAALGSSTTQVSLLGLPAPSSEVDGGPLLGGSGKTQPCSWGARGLEAVHTVSQELTVWRSAAIRTGRTSGVSWPNRGCTQVLWAPAPTCKNVHNKIAFYGFGIKMNIFILHRWFRSKESACKAGATRDPGLIPGSGRSPGGGRGHPLQYSCLENPIDRWKWRAPTRGVEESESDTTEATWHTCTRTL